MTGSTRCWVFTALGPSEEQGVRLLRAFGYYLVGAGLDETAGYSRGPSATVPVPDEVVEQEFPNVAAAGKYFVPDEREATFEAGLELFHAGIEGKLAATAP